MRLSFTTSSPRRERAGDARHEHRASPYHALLHRATNGRAHHVIDEYGGTAGRERLPLQCYEAAGARRRDTILDNGEYHDGGQAAEQHPTSHGSIIWFGFELRRTLRSRRRHPARYQGID